MGIVWTPSRAGRTAIRGSGGIFYDQNHNNFNAIYIVNTLLSDGFTPGRSGNWSEDRRTCKRPSVFFCAHKRLVS